MGVETLRINEKVIELVGSSKRKIALILFLVSLGLYLLGNGGHSLWDRDESRYAGTASAMLKSGDWVVPRLNGEYRFHKPIMIYWLMSLSMLLFGVNEFSARAVSAIAGAATVVLIYEFARRLHCSLKGAAVAALVAMLSSLLLLTSKAATTDAVVTLTVTGAMLLYYVQEQEFSWWRHVAFWGILGVSALTKGPPGPAIVALAIVCDKIIKLRARERTNRKNLGKAVWHIVSGLIIFCAVCLPWAILVWQKTNGEFFRVAVGHHVLDRSLTPFEGHKGPIFYYVPVLLVATFPFTAMALVSVRWMWTRRSSPEGRLLFCWLIPAFIMFSVVSTKLPHYMAPLLPSVALMIGLWWSSLREDDTQSRDSARISNGWWLSGAIIVAIMGCGIALALPVAVIHSGLGVILLPASAVSAILFSISLVGSYWWSRRLARKAFLLWACGMAAVIVLGMLWLLPSMEPLRPSKMLVSWVRDNAPESARLVAVKYQEPSLVFYWGQNVEMLGTKEYDAALEELMNPVHPAALITTEDIWRTWQKKYEPPSSVRIRKSGRFYIFQRGRWENLAIVGGW